MFSQLITIFALQGCSVNTMLHRLFLTTLQLCRCSSSILASIVVNSSEPFSSPQANSPWLPIGIPNLFLASLHLQFPTQPLLPPMVPSRELIPIGRRSCRRSVVTLRLWRIWRLSSVPWSTIATRRGWRRTLAPLGTARWGRCTVRTISLATITAITSWRDGCIPSKVGSSLSM